uniref:Uncharacterized protein n=1 Tax=candidate division WWE3 bacterium TaxID=2053526 RepID=A0A831Z117_UNCKA
MAVKLEFRKAPEPGTLLYLEKPTVLTTPEKGAAGFRKFWRAEEPLPGVKKEGETVYLRAEPVNPEEVESRKSEAADMREYLTDETLAQLKISRTESSPEALPLAA